MTADGGATPGNKRKGGGREETKPSAKQLHQMTQINTTGKLLTQAPKPLTQIKTTGKILTQAMKPPTDTNQHIN